MAYYRIYLNSKNEVAIVQMGECDEIDYNQNRFLSSQRFDTEEEAIEYLGDNQRSLSSSVNNPYSKSYRGILD